jgi:hypothetical protein
VSLDYGSPDDPEHQKHGDFVFDAQNKGQRKFSVFMDKALDTSYRYAVDYHFDPEVDWDADTFGFTFGPQPTEDRALFLNPFEQLSLLEVKVFPNRWTRSSSLRPTCISPGSATTARPGSASSR